MMAKERTFYDQSKSRVLDNAELAAWLRFIEDRLNSKGTPA
jgi:hypothetical protein